MVGRKWACGLVLVLGMGWGPQVNAAPREIRFKDIPLEIKEGDRLVVTGIRATVRLSTPKAEASASQLILRAKKVLKTKSQSKANSQFEALNFSVRRDGETWFIESKGPESKRDWEEWLESSGPEMVFDIESPALPVEISVHDGQVVVANWKQGVTASLIHGQIKTIETEGPLRLQVQKGDVHIRSHRGRADIDSYGAKLVAQKVDGDVGLTNFGGETTLSDVKGNVVIRAHSGPVGVHGSKGSIEFDVGRSALNVKEFEGPIRGKSDLGPVTAALLGEAEVQIESNQGSVAVRLPASSGAAVRLSSEEGLVTAPSPLKPSHTSAGRAATGRLDGRGPKGNVSIKTKSGAIRVR